MDCAGMHRARALLALPALGLALAGCGGGDRVEGPPPQAPDRITLTSPAFADGETIPKRYSCDGQGIAPPLRWSGVPAGAHELALLVEDPDAPGGTFVHWVLFKLAPDLRRLDAARVPAGARQGKNSAGDDAWTGPCPPGGATPHHYVFTLYALRTPLSEPNGASADAIRSAVSAAAIARGRLVARFGR
jgi:Raf kinase inhibitor-like YbhB/YbcL family protein